MMYSKFISFLKQIPLPICGLILGLISLGNLLYSKGYPILGNSYDMLGLFLMFLILLKIVLAMKHTISTLNDNFYDVFNVTKCIFKTFVRL